MRRSRPAARTVVRFPGLAGLHGAPRPRKEAVRKRHELDVIQATVQRDDLTACGHATRSGTILSRANWRIHRGGRTRRLRTRYASRFDRHPARRALTAA